MAFDANDLSPHEQFVVDRTRDGEIADFTPMAGPDGAKPPIRAGFLRKLLLQLDPNWAVRMPGVRVAGARIEGVLDLSDCSGAGGTGLPALELLNCDIPEPMDLSHARLARLCLKHSAFTHLRAPAARIDGPLDFSHARPAQDGGLCWIDARGATIEGRVDGGGAQLAIDESVPHEPGAQAYALVLREAKIGNGVCLRPDFVAIGGVSLFDAVVDGLVDARGALLKAVGRRAFNIGNLRVSGVMSLTRGFRCEGPIWARGAVLGGGLNMDGGAIVVREGEAHGLYADNCEIAEDLQLRNRFTCNAPVSFVGASVRGGVEIQDATFTAKGAALDFRNATIEGAFTGGASINGTLVLAGASIGGNLDLRGCEITPASVRGSNGKSPDYGVAVDAASLRVRGAAFFKGVNVKGEIFLADARIEGYLAFGGSRFLNNNGWAIRAPNVRVGGNLTLKIEDGDPTPFGAKTVIEGGAKFDRAQVEGAVAWLNIELRGAAPGKIKGALLSFADARIGGTLEAHGLTTQDAEIDLSGAGCATLDDDTRTGWGPEQTQLNLDGFSYDRLEGDGKDDGWKARLAWLKRAARATDGRVSPQPFAALARVYAKAGRPDDMRRALRAQRKMLTRALPFWSPTRHFSGLFGLFAGYGLSPTRAFLSLAVFLLVGVAGVLAMDAQRALVRPDGSACAGAVEPALYAIDVALPVLDLGQESVCAPGRAPGAELFAGVTVPNTHWRLFEGVALWRWALGIYAVLGSILTALAVITFSGVMKPKSEE